MSGRWILPAACAMAASYRALMRPDCRTGMDRRLANTGDGGRRRIRRLFLCLGDGPQIEFN